jgi:hypothetical protein
MEWWQYAAWGVAGAFAVAGLEVVSDIKSGRRLPWGNDEDAPMKTGAFFVGLIFRLVISGIVATATGLGGVVTGVFGAFCAGIAAPLIVEKAGQTIKPFAGVDLTSTSSGSSDTATSQPAAPKGADPPAASSAEPSASIKSPASSSEPGHNMVTSAGDGNDSEARSGTGDAVTEAPDPPAEEEKA